MYDTFNYCTMSKYYLFIQLEIIRLFHLFWKWRYIYIYISDFTIYNIFLQINYKISYRSAKRKIQRACIMEGYYRILERVDRYFYIVSKNITDIESFEEK